MARLSEVLGAVVSEVARARMKADLESAQMALLYQQTELLKDFSVPRFRLPKVQIDLPMVVSGLSTPSDPSTADPEPVRILPPEAYGRAISIATKLAESALRQLRRRDWNQSSLKKAMKEELELWRTELPDGVSPAEAIDRIVARLADWARQPNHVQPAMQATTIDQLGAKIREALSPKLAELTTTVERPLTATRERTIPHPSVALSSSSGSIDGLLVEVSTGVVREAPADRVVRLTLEVSEDGLEWATVEDADGNTVRRLVPE